MLPLRRKRRRRMPFVVSLLLLVALAYGFFAFFAWMAADGVLFQPQRTSYYELPGRVDVRASDGTAITTVHLPNPAATHTILLFHGNAEDLGDVQDRMRDLHAHGFAVVSMDYRGYGMTAGIPSEANILADARVVYRHMVEQLGIPANRIILYGRSVGSGPAVELARHEDAAGLVLENAFVSAFRTITGIPLLPGDRFRNLARMPHVRCPVLVMHGTFDRTVPFSHGKKLFAAAPEPKRCLWIEGAGHNNFVDIAGERYWTALREFVDLLRAREAERT